MTVPDFDYTATSERLEIPLKDRIRAIRAQKAEQRARQAANAARKGAQIRNQPAPAPRGADHGTPRRGRPARRGNGRPPRGSR